MDSNEVIQSCLRYLDKINFLGITLLPFSKGQIDYFIRGWIDDEVISSALVRQIGEKGLYDVVKNPLLATIVCSLAVNHFETPDNEVEIYRKRFELLCSTYDEHKRIKRTETPQNILMTCCRNIAIHLHFQNLREATISDMIEAVYSATFKKYKRETVKLAVNELISPCNILLSVTGTDVFTFGHLRFQEFLVAEEITANRAIDILGYFDSDWWRGVLYLYAFDHDVSHFVEELYKRFGKIYPALKTLNKMIEARPTATQSELRRLVDRFLAQDREDSYIYLDMDDHDMYFSDASLEGLSFSRNELD